MIDLTEYDNRSEYLLHVSSKKHHYFRIEKSQRSGMEIN